MRLGFKKIIAMAAVFLWGMAVFAQAPEATALWKAGASVDGDLVTLTFTGDIVEGWHIYTTADKNNPTTISFTEAEGWELAGDLEQVSEPEDFEGNPVIFGQMVLRQKVRLTSEKAVISGLVEWFGCNDKFCAAPEEWDFAIEVSSEGASIASATRTEAASSDGTGTGSISDAGEEDAQKSSGIWGLIIEAIIWGFAMLLTPCVFPMVPMTISFFMKQSESAAEGRFKAFLYGLFIVLLYTLPICIIIGLTWTIGGNAVTADIFNWLATHWLPNIIFFVVFMIFAASFFGAFEIELPSSLANKTDAKSSAKGIGGIFFMALTLVLVSFSCTGPIVGTVLIKSTQGEFWTPIATMLAFSTAFALPFTILAMFPSLLKKVKGSGGSWLNSVKVVLGFIEVALGFKFLSVADQTYHWGLLDREVYLAIWITVFSLLGFYLLGKLRFKNDEPVEHISVFRLSLAIAVLSFVMYMIPGMWGAPLKAISGYLPPISTQDFVITGQPSMTSHAPEAPEKASNKYGLSLPLGLDGYFTIEEGLEASRKEGKPVFVDMTGHGCVNCREMEQRVWSDPKVREILEREYILVALYMDDKTPLAEEDWIRTEDGKVIKQLGRANSYIARSRFNVNAQPNYALLDADGSQMLPVRGYDLSIDGFIEFLNEGIEKYREMK